LILSVDPGPVQSAWVTWDGSKIHGCAIVENSLLCNEFVSRGGPADILVIEQIKSYGMTVSDTIFDTVFWTGRFAQAWEPGKWVRVPRMDVKMHFCHQAKARDANIRQALIDRFEPGLLPRKKPCGILKGLHADLWAAFALGVYYYDNFNS